MKRFALLISVFILFSSSANAALISNPKTKLGKSLQISADKRAIKSVIKEQSKYSAKYDRDGLSNLYSKNFKSSDGFDKEVYFKLIDDTWKSYPDITYTTKVRDITFDGDKAAVHVDETSLATVTKLEEGLEAYGELNSYSCGTYFLQKENDKWRFVGEKINNEKSMLRFGDARYVKMDLVSPYKVKPNEYYTASLFVDTPPDALVIASIGRDNITYPQEKTEEVYRKLPDDNILERMFLSNKQGKNEYNVATIGLTKSREDAFGKVNVYMAGIAFIMVRVNVEEAVDGK